MTDVITLPRGSQHIGESTLILKVRNGGHKSQKGIKRSPRVKYFNEVKLPVTTVKFIRIDDVLKAPGEGEAEEAY